MWIKDIRDKHLVPFDIWGHFFGGEKVCLHLNDSQTRQAIKNRDMRLFDALESAFTFADTYKGPAWGQDQLAWDHFAQSFEDSEKYETFLLDLISNPFSESFIVEGSNNLTVKGMAENELIALRKKKKPKTEKSTNGRSGFVYVLQADTKGEPCKIGRSRVPDKRTEWIGLRVPFRTTVIHVIQSDDMIEAESQLHAKFDHCRQEGEWFNLTPDDVRAVKRLTRFEDGRFWTNEDST